ncbi:hypothetical protein AAHA92_23141 [Salvia divinorum]|uniref:TF-B3 domain-containing protein n=1 Tax=Salvia divinorum TaxID=28513 RepID=A0ABD1GS22_SALDI
MSKGRTSIESDDHHEEASRERKLTRRNPNQEEEAPVPQQELLFEKRLTYSDAKYGRLVITGADRQKVTAFLTDAERKMAVGDGLRVVATDANGAEYTMELKRNAKPILSNGWAELARANEAKCGDSVNGFGSRAATGAGGKFRLKLNIIRK